MLEEWRPLREYNVEIQKQLKEEKRDDDEIHLAYSYWENQLVVKLKNRPRNNEVLLVFSEPEKLVGMQSYNCSYIKRVAIPEEERKANYGWVEKYENASCVRGSELIQRYGKEWYENEGPLFILDPLDSPDSNHPTHYCLKVTHLFFDIVIDSSELPEMKVISKCYRNYPEIRKI